jgi:hypothetical protein
MIIPFVQVLANPSNEGQGSNVDCSDLESVHTIRDDLKVLLRRTCAALLVDDVCASEHDLHGDNDCDVFAHSRSRRSDDWFKSQYFYFAFEDKVFSLLAPSVAGRPSVRPPLTLLIVDCSSLRCSR